jgi:predicted lactoylglutathione lyase
MPSRMLFVNLAIEDAPRAQEFWSALGFEFDEQFTGENSVCLMLSEMARVMLLNHETFSSFTTRPIADTTSVSEGMFAITCESREAVDAMVGLALAHGGRPAMPSQDHGAMYSWSFYCPDGHHWEPFWIDVTLPEGDEEDEGDDL